MTEFTKAESDAIYDRMIDVFCGISRLFADMKVSDHEAFLASILIANVAAIGMDMPEKDVAQDVTEMRKTAQELVRQMGAK